MWMGDWWWETQHHLPSGSTITPVILVSNKTELSRFKGDKNAWPVCLSIRNLSKECDNSLVAMHQFYLATYPYPNSNHLTTTQLVDNVYTGWNGVELVCTDRQIWRVFPILATYIRDHPKQCLIACCAENQCINTQFPPHDQTQTTCTLHAQTPGQYPPNFVAQDL
ncbi:hypothetical protein F5141DRAFT_1190107 [Pisolithus sp. B1]|nr:hypothetical protein F5141DRAFT_1190107 [Pisolithus sp. B1]